MNETALRAINNGTIAFTRGELAILALEIPNNEATGLAQTPIQAPLLQQAKNNGMTELILPVMVIHIVFNLFIFRIFFNKLYATLMQNGEVIHFPLPL